MSITTLPEEGMNLQKETANFRLRIIREALERTKGNKEQTNKLLKINRTTLVEILRRAGCIKPIYKKSAKTATTDDDANDFTLEKVRALVL